MTAAADDDNDLTNESMAPVTLLVPHSLSLSLSVLVVHRIQVVNLWESLFAFFFSIQIFKFLFVFNDGKKVDTLYKPLPACLADCLADCLLAKCVKPLGSFLRKKKKEKKKEPDRLTAHNAHDLCI